MNSFFRKLTLLTLCLLLAALPIALAETQDDHFLLSEKDEGGCKRLTGDVKLTVVTVDLPSAPWDEEGLYQLTATIDDAMAWLEAEAIRYSAPLDVNVQYHFVHVDAEPVHIGDNISSWARAVLDADPALPAFYPENAIQACSPVLLCMNTPGRAFACSYPGEDIQEYCVLYKNVTAATLCHELLHLYGTGDYYSHDTVAQAAKTHYTNSIMLATDQAYPVDSLTAYIIGWVEELDAAALAMLADTAHLTEEDIGAAATVQVQDGYHTETKDGNVYTGLFQDGMYHGWGRMEWHSGDTYEGEWQFGVRTGVGIMTWADGSVYTGNFANGTYQGQGCLQMADGSVYTGSFSNGQITGSGQMTWPDGSMYTGSFTDYLFNGEGQMRYPDGTVCSGTFVNGVQSGQGSILWPNGTTYIGEFVNGERTGQGKLIWPDGSIYCGAFLNGTYHGYGTLDNPDGQHWEGQWENGVLIGQ